MNTPNGPFWSRHDESHQPIIQYIASALTAGTYTSIPELRTPSIRDSYEIRQFWDRINDVYRAQLVSFVQRQAARRPVNGQLQGTIDNLRTHSMRTDPSMGNTTIYELQSLLPDLTAEISRLQSHPPFTPFGMEDAYVLSLVRWFKQSYMRWVDPILCPTCSGPTASTGVGEPTPQERQEGGGRVELHACSKEGCGGLRRFVRYGRVAPLLRTREGRCGEFAHLFYAFLRAVGSATPYRTGFAVKARLELHSRYIWNSEDHVWCEYWSPSLKHWVHVDPSEGVINKPLLYARGWGKKQAYCLAFGAHGAEDVTRAYVDDYNDACRGRRQARGWNEKDLQRLLYAHTVGIRLRMDDAAERARLAAMDQAQALWIGDEGRRFAEAERMEMGGRTSGPEEWRAMRSELGSSSTSVVKPRIASSTLVEVPRSKLRVFGSAEFSNDGLVLTSGPGQTASVFYPTPISQDDKFHFSMTFRLTSPPGAGEADGIAIVFAPQPKLGGGGFGLGYSGLGDQGDLAVEIDTYRTQDHADDPPTPHISVHSPPHAHHKHSIACTSPGNIPFLSDGRAYALELFYDGGSRRLKGYLAVPADQSGGSPDEVEVCDVVIPSPPAAESGKGWFLGMTAACGGLWQKQEILDWKLELVTFVDKDEGVSPQMRDTEGIANA